MASIDELLEDIDDTLGSIVSSSPTMSHGATTSSSLTSSSRASDVFEAYVFALVVQAAQIEGANVSFWNVDGTRTTSTFVFRTSPSDIYSRAQTYSHAVIEFADRPTLEAHLGVYVAGKSRVRHEMDVSVLWASEAHMCRQERVLPRPRAVELAVECKFYAGTISLNLARAFIGLGSDLSTKNHYFVINNTSVSA